MACRRSQVRSLSGPPFETIRTRRKAGFLFVVWGQARSAPLKAQEGALRCGLGPQSKNAERRVFCLWLGQARFGARGGVFLRGAAVLGVRRWQARSAPLKAGKVCVPVISP